MATLLCNGSVLDFSGGKQCPTTLKLQEPLVTRMNSSCYAVIEENEVFVSPIPCENRIHVFNFSTGALERSVELPLAINDSTSPNLILKGGRIYVYRALDTYLYEIRHDKIVEVARTARKIMSLQIAEEDDTFRFLYSDKRGRIFSVRSVKEGSAVEHEVRIEGSESNYLVGYRQGDLILWTSQNELLVVYRDKSQFKQKIPMTLSVRNFIVEDTLYIGHLNAIGVFSFSTRKFRKVKLHPPFLLLERTKSTNITFL